MTTRPRIHLAAQFLAPGAGGIGRCARLTAMALSSAAEVSALAVADEGATTIGEITARTFRGERPAFVVANALEGLRADWVFYDFAGTARAHAPLRLAGKPYAVWAHGLEVWRDSLRRDYAKVLTAASAVFVNSRHTRQRLLENVPGVRSVHLCPLGTEKDADSTASARPAGPREKMVLFVGRNDVLFAKGQDVLIEVWPDVARRAPGAVLCFVGGGDQLDRLRALAAASPAAASIRVLGPLSDEEVAQLYGRARLFAMPSTAEGFGLVFAEAMSHGLPVLTSTQDASQETNVDGETGYSVDRNDLETLAARIVGILEDDGLFGALSAGAYDYWHANFRFSVFRERFLKSALDAGLLKHPRRKLGNRGAGWGAASHEGAVRDCCGVSEHYPVGQSLVVDEEHDVVRLEGPGRT